MWSDPSGQMHVHARGERARRCFQTALFGQAIDSFIARRAPGTSFCERNADLPDQSDGLTQEISCCDRLFVRAIYREPALLSANILSEFIALENDESEVRTGILQQGSETKRRVRRRAKTTPICVIHGDLVKCYLRTSSILKYYKTFMCALYFVLFGLSSYNS